MASDKDLFLSKGEKTFKFINVVLLSIFGLCAIYPLWYVFISSISSPDAVVTGKVMFWPKDINVEAYKHVFKMNEIWIAYGNTMFYTVVGTIVNLFFTTTGAFVLSRKSFPGKKLLTMMVIVTLWFKAGMIPFYLNLRDLHLVNTRTAVIVAFGISTFNLILMRTFFESIPASLEEAAKIDGASTFKIFRKIYLPLSKPALATIGLYYAITRWNGYFWAMAILRDDSKLPIQVLLKKLIVEQDLAGEAAGIITSSTMVSQETMIYTIIVISIIPMILAYPFVQKYFKKGTMIGSVKG